MRRFDRYLAAELLWPSALATLIALFLLLVNRFFKLAPLIMGAQVEVGSIFSAMRFLIPPYLVTALPVAFYMAVIVVLHRMVRNGEWGALMAAGVSPMRATAMIPLLSLLMAGWAEYTVWTLNPAGRVRFYEESQRLINSSAHRALAPGVVHNLRNGFAVYMTGRKGNQWQQPAFLYRQSAQSNSWLITADSADVIYNEAADRWDFQLHDGWAYSHPAAPWISFGSMHMSASPFAARRVNLNAKERTLAQLAAVYESSSGKFARDCIAEKHSRILLGMLMFLLPLAAVGLGLGEGRRRGGKGGSLMAGLAVFGLFYLVTSFGRKLGVAWSGPVWVPMYSGVGIFSLFCLWLYGRVR